MSKLKPEDTWCFCVCMMFLWKQSTILVGVNIVVVIISESHTLWKISMYKISLVKTKMFIHNFLFWVHFKKNPISPQNQTFPHTDSTQDDCSLG